MGCTIMQPWYMGSGANDTLLYLSALTRVYANATTQLYIFYPRLLLAQATVLNATAWVGYLRGTGSGNVSRPWKYL
jgi:hypothetical protein